MSATLYCWLQNGFGRWGKNYMIKEFFLNYYLMTFSFPVKTRSMPKGHRFKVSNRNMGRLSEKKILN